MILTLLLVVIYLSFISLGLPDSLLGSAWPAMYTVLNVPLSYAGIVSMITAGGTIISSFLSGTMIKRLGTGKVTAISVLMTAGALLGVSFTKSFFVVCILAVPLGLGAGSVDAALNNYIALHYKAKHMSWLHCFWGIGATTGPIIMSYSLQYGGTWSLGFLTISVIQFVLVIILFISLPLWNKVSQETSVVQAEQRPELKIKQLLRLSGAKTVLIVFFCYCALEATTGLWGSSYLVTVKGISSETAARWISMFYFGITFGRFLSGFMTMKFNNRQMIKIGLSLLTGGVIILLIPLGHFSLLAGFFLIGLGCAPIYPSLIHETPVIFGSENSQQIMGVQMGFAYIGSTFIPLLFGVIAAQVSYTLFPILLSALLLLMIIMIKGLKKESNNKTIKSLE